MVRPFRGSMIFFRVEGFTEVDGAHAEVTQQYSRTELEYILTRNRKIGEALLSEMERIMSEPHTVPVSVDLIQRFGYTQEFVKK